VILTAGLYSFCRSLRAKEAFARQPGKAFDTDEDVVIPDDDGDSDMFFSHNSQSYTFEKVSVMSSRPVTVEEPTGVNYFQASTTRPSSAHERRHQNQQKIRNEQRMESKPAVASDSCGFHIPAKFVPEPFNYDGGDDFSRSTTATASAVRPGTSVSLFRF
jgi:hypothetical protein